MKEVIVGCGLLFLADKGCSWSIIEVY